MKKTLTTEKFIEHMNSHKPICITCPKHGEFYQIPNIHLFNGECPICKHIKEIRIQKQK